MSIYLKFHNFQSWKKKTLINYLFIFKFCITCQWKKNNIFKFFDIKYLKYSILKVEFTYDIWIFKRRVGEVGHTSFVDISPFKIIAWKWMRERERERERTYHICLFKGHISFLKNHFFHPFFSPSKVAIKAIHYLQKRIFLSPMIPGGYYKKRGKKGGEVGRGEIIGGGLYAGSVKPSPYTTKMWTLMFVS